MDHPVHFGRLAQIQILGGQCHQIAHRAKEEEMDHLVMWDPVLVGGVLTVGNDQIPCRMIQ